MKRVYLLYILGILILLGVVIISPSINDNVKIYIEIPNEPAITETYQNFTYKINRTFPHENDSFTQGLVFDNDYLYEGTGLYGNSSIRKVEIETGKAIQIRNLSEDFFGEGITIFNDKIIQLTWKSKIGFIYDKESFELIDEFNYTTEGWGITHDTKNLIMSDGTSILYYLNPQTFEIVKEINVNDNKTPINNLNELEFINGEIYANVWKTDKIAKINPETGNITGWIFLNDILNHNDIKGRIDVLNGIAYDSSKDRIFVTGKWWPYIFEIELVELDN